MYEIEVMTVVKMSVVNFWVVTLCPEDGYDPFL